MVILWAPLLHCCLSLFSLTFYLLRHCANLMFELSSLLENMIKMMMEKLYELKTLGQIKMKVNPIGGLLRMKTLLFVLLISFSVRGEDRKMIGTALLEYSIFKIDIYQITYFKGPEDLEELVLDYKTDVKRKYSQEGWKVGLGPIIKKKDLKPEQVKWIFDNTVDLAKGDKLTIRKQKDQVTLLKNGTSVATIKDPLIALVILYPWLGDKPIDKDLKAKLLGNSSS